ncbi:MAG: hypothetical protein R3C03_23795 [Pirellulaceae bacterium]
MRCGDWLTAWTLLDLFLLLVFTFAVGRLWGIHAGVIAFLAFGLCYHEPGSPRLTWLLLLIPLAILRYVPTGRVTRWITGLKWFSILLLFLFLLPFLGSLLQNALFPQLESPGINYQHRTLSDWMYDPFPTAPSAEIGNTYDAPESNVRFDDTESLDDSGGGDLFGRSNVPSSQQLQSEGRGKGQVVLQSNSFNMAYEAKTKIQTGPAQPLWSWNRVNCYWDGPVSAEQRIQPILISAFWNRILNGARILLTLALLGVLFGRTRKVANTPSAQSVVNAGLLLAILFASVLPSSASAQEFPDATILKELRQRLTDSPDTFAGNVSIPNTNLLLEGSILTTTLEIHAAARIAVPLPGSIDANSPVSVQLNGNNEVALCRRDGYIWIVLEAGVHTVQIKSQLKATDEWEWTFLLPPQRLEVAAEGWTIKGVNRDGVPENRVLFTRDLPQSDKSVSFERRDYNAIVVVERHLEVGLIWQVRNVVRRIEPQDKSISIRIPLLENEQVLAASGTVRDGHIEVFLANDQNEISWSSEIPVGMSLELQANQSGEWIEQWYLETSPIWNVEIEGLSPIFESNVEKLIPVWRPWPGESATLAFKRPEAMEGETLTIQNVQHDIELGLRQFTSTLEFRLESSLGNEFRIRLPEAMEIERLTIDESEYPVRYDAGDLVVPVHPGFETVRLETRTATDLTTNFRSPEIKLPLQASNINTSLRVPSSRWILWTSGPTMGPAVRLWIVLGLALIIAIILGRISNSPLRLFEWVLLAIGLTQVHVLAALFCRSMVLSVGASREQGRRRFAQLGFQHETAVDRIHDRCRSNHFDSRCWQRPIGRSRNVHCWKLFVAMDVALDGATRGRHASGCRSRLNNRLDISTADALLGGFGSLGRLFVG